MRDLDSKPSSWVRRGRELLLAGNTQAAADCAERALKLQHEHPCASWLRGCVRERRRTFREAAVDFRVAAVGAPDDAMAWARLGAVLHRLGEVDEALAALRRAAAIDAQDPMILNDLGHCLVAHGKLSEALEKFRAALETLPSFVHAHLGLAQVARMRGDLQAALGHARRAHALDLQDHKAAILLASLKSSGEREAQRLLADVSTRYADPSDHLMMAQIFEEGGASHEARTHLMEISKQEPRTPADWSALAYAHARLIGPQDAAQVCLRGTREFPADIDLRATRVGLLIDAGRTEEAAEEARSLANTVPRHPDQIEAVVQTLSDAMLYEEARAFLRRIISDLAVDARLRVRLTGCYPLAATDTASAEQLGDEAI